MTLSPLALMVVLGLIVAIGFSFAMAYAKRHKTFTWREYGSLLLVPVAVMVPVVFTYGVGILWFFLASVVVGLFFEHVCGYVFHKVLHRHMWRYYRFTLGGYTSLLVAPFWGMAGVFFFILTKAFAL